MAIGESGYFYTSGNQILDYTDTNIRLKSVSWFGFEGSDGVIDGLWMDRSYTDYLDQIKSLGFNSVRLPFAAESLTYVPNTTDSNAPAYTYLSASNSDFLGKSTLEMMDMVVDYAETIDLMVVLDHHRMTLGVGTENGLWSDGTYTVDDWISGWEMLAGRYAGNANVVGADVQNEPYNGTWGGGGATDWAQAAQDVGNAILAVNPNWLIFVEGVQTYDGQDYWWGGNLEGVADLPIVLDTANKVVYSPHDYPSSVSDQPWFDDPSYPANLPGVWDDYWGYIYREGIAPVWIGEFGTKLQTTSDEQWLGALTAYMDGDFDDNGSSDIPVGDMGISWSYFGWGPNSGDTGGILQDDWVTVNTDKTAYLFNDPLPSASSGVGSQGELPVIDDWTSQTSSLWQISFRTAPTTAIGLFGQSVDESGSALSSLQNLGLALGVGNGAAPGMDSSRFTAEIAPSLAEGNIEMSAFLYESMRSTKLDLIKISENSYTLSSDGVFYADLTLAAEQPEAGSLVRQVGVTSVQDILVAVPLGLIVVDDQSPLAQGESYDLSFGTTMSRSADLQGQFGLYLGDLATGNPINPATGEVITLADLGLHNIDQFSVHEAGVMVNGQVQEDEFSVSIDGQDTLGELGLFPYYEVAGAGADTVADTLFVNGHMIGDGVSHIVRTGMNTFGVEDMVGGDYDYNDLVVQIQAL